jgi:hypothetical protein
MTTALIHTGTIKSSIIGIIVLISLLLLLWYMYYKQVNIQYTNEGTQAISTLYNIKNGLKLLGFTFAMVIIIIILVKSKEGMKNSTATINSTDPMVISQTTAGAIKTIHDQLQPIQITQELVDQLMDAANNQSDQLSTLQTNSN